MAVTVVEVREVGVSVQDLRVFVDVGVARRWSRRVVVIVMFVVGVFVEMLRRPVLMFVFVAAPDHERNTSGGDQERNELSGGGGFAEHTPSDDRSDERRRGEDELSACRAEVACAGDPEGDRSAVPEAADDECSNDGAARRDVGEYEPDDEVRAAGDHSLCQRDVARADLVDGGGGAVVDGPAQARSGNQDAAPAEVGAS
jgi:hypothetical protein